MKAFFILRKILHQIYTIFKLPFKEIEDRKPSSGLCFTNLDGFRGVAVLLVIIAHTGAYGLPDAGGTGVLMFFVLSGFLLTFPLVYKKRPPDRTFLTNYFKRRLKRIYPLYVFVIFLQLYLLNGVVADRWDPPTQWEKFIEFSQYASLYKAGGHFWSIAQEVSFYIVLPIILVTNYYVWKNKIPLLLLFGYLFYELAYKYIDNDYIYIRWNGGRQGLYWHIFAIGCLAAYAAVPILKHKSKLRYLNPIIAPLTLAVIAYLCAGNYKNLIFLQNLTDIRFGSSILHPSSEALAWLAGGAIISLLVFDFGILKIIFSSRILRAIGVLGYGMYLIHPYVIDWNRRYQWNIVSHPDQLFLLVTAITFFISTILYYFIEKPFYVNSYRKMGKDFLTWTSRALFTHTRSKRRGITQYLSETRPTNDTPKVGRLES